jgi:hypothetical protein
MVALGANSIHGIRPAARTPSLSRETSTTANPWEHSMKNHLLISIAGILALSIGAARAQISYTLAADGLPSASNPTLNNLNQPFPFNLTLSGNAYLLTGSTAQGSTPYFYGSTASYFGEAVDPINGFDASQYVAVNIGGSATLSFSTPQTQFGLLWGSVDPGNALTFYDNHNNIVGSISGSTFGSAIWSFNGWNTIYVNLTSLVPFSSVVATTTSPGAFEFDDVAYAPVPEPTSGCLFGAGLCVLGFRTIRRWRGSAEA